MWLARCNVPVSANLSTVELPASLITFCHRVREAGGQAWLVGGWVRDHLLGRGKEEHGATDFDLEIYRLMPDRLYALAQAIGRVVVVGKHFGVLKLVCDGVEMDVALPRSEYSTGDGHRDFSIHFDLNLAPEQACARRDFTINAMMFDPLSHQLLDLHGGREDWHHGLLHHVGEAFVEDPLRPLRGMQFCARFNLVLAAETARLCQGMVGSITHLPVERIWMEWRKWGLSDYPAAGLFALEQSGWLACYPKFLPMVGCRQEACWHPEGDVWRHTMLVCDAAAAIARRQGLAERQRLVLLFAALCHDLGKPTVSVMDEQGVVRSPGHAVAGVKPSQAWLQQIGAPAWLVAAVLPLVREHLVHLHGEPTTRAVRRLSSRLQPVDIVLWEQLVEADASGRAPHPPDRPALPWLQQAQAMEIMQRPPRPIVTGRWLLAHGMQPGKSMGEIIAAAWQAQLDGEITSVETAEVWWNIYSTD
ncbi:MAG: HD domain-containing protein [Mariprofundales bacterium]